MPNKAVVSFVVVLVLVMIALVYLGNAVTDREVLAGPLAEGRLITTPTETPSPSPSPSPMETPTPMPTLTPTPTMQP